MKVQDIALDKVIIDPERVKRRPVGDVGDLAESIRLIGLLHPITVRPDLTLIAGWHRLEAAHKLGWKKIPAQVMDLDDLHAALAEIDENLSRNDLVALDRADTLQRRKEIYEALYPETKRGAAGGESTKSKHRGGLTRETIVSPTFVESTARLTNRSVAPIYRDLQIANNIDESVKEKLRGTLMADKKEELLELTKHDTPSQALIVERVQTGQAPSVKSAARQLINETKAAMDGYLSNEETEMHDFRLAFAKAMKRVTEVMVFPVERVAETHTVEEIARWRNTTFAELHRWLDRVDAAKPRNIRRVS